MSLTMRGGILSVDSEETSLSVDIVCNIVYRKGHGLVSISFRSSSAPDGMELVISSFRLGPSPIYPTPCL
jgi:hypothetical protein